MHSLSLHSAVQRCRQGGVAAIEFAFIVALMAMILLGSTMYWRALQAQQSVTRAAGDGARYVLGACLNGSTTAQLVADARQVIQQSLQVSGVPMDSKTATQITLLPDYVLQVVHPLPPLFGSADSDGPAQPIGLGHWGLTEPVSLQATVNIAC